jgi:hypothetical protein
MSNMITIVGIDAENVGSPRNGGRGGALYQVPIKLDETPSQIWSRLFPENWDHPPEWSNMHRPGIAQVRGSCIVLNGTTVEEVRDVHAKTLELAVRVTNEQAAAVAERERVASEAAAKTETEHRAKVADIASEVRFNTPSDN